eukprot:10673199-Ditylum_brightwellii.AAC.1
MNKTVRIEALDWEDDVGGDKFSSALRSKWMRRMWMTCLSAEELYSRSKNELKEGETLFIATDERDKKFFQPLANKYNVCFLDDFQDKITVISSNYYGMLNQLVAPKG